jgi:hypothetical protein
MNEPSKETYIQAITKMLESLPTKKVAQLYRFTQRLWSNVSTSKGV